MKNLTSADSESYFSPPWETRILGKCKERKKAEEILGQMKAFSGVHSGRLKKA